MSGRSLLVASLCVATMASGGACGDEDPEMVAGPPDDAGAVDAAGADAADGTETAAPDGRADATGACVRPGPRTVRGLSAGAGYSLALLENGNVMFWGATLGDTSGEGIYKRLTRPIFIDTGCRKAVEVAAGRLHACVRLDDGQVRCWGRNDAGQLGIPAHTTQLQPATPANLGPGRTAVGLAGGHQHTCARLDDGQLRCFGTDVLDGQTGNQLIPFAPGRTVTAVGAGDLHTCAALDNGELRCWGANDDGQLGVGDQTPRLRPDDVVNVGPGRRAVDIVAGYHFTCARLDSGEVKCWGLNNAGQLGLGDTSTRLAPTAAVALGPGRTAMELAAGFHFVCARLDDGAVKCWGSNASGEVGVGDADPHPSPSQAVDLGTGLKAVEIAAGMTHTCARLDSGIVKCWGDNDSRALGIADPLHRGDNADELGDNLPAVPLGD
jgi:alpha-tubulin suppressor-like RCC1 family protein